MNIAVVRGRVIRPPEERETTVGRIVSIDVAIESDERPVENVEVVWADPPAARALPRQGAEVVAIGRVRRRFFRNQAGATVSRTEVVADAVFTARQRSLIERRLALVAADMTA